MSIIEQVNRRRTFAIISHPDAGKTTMTEKLLLFGNIIREAGTVKGKKTGKFATSDWMEIEKKRGISVTSSVMSFPYKDFYVNILDTPGHDDFSEDTYRTLTAVDSVVMIIDSTKGVEPQTIKLFKVCRMRGIPIFTFINKLDREGKDPLELLSEIEEVLGIESYPMNWPVGMGKSFQGLIDRHNDQFIRFLGDEREQIESLDELRKSGDTAIEAVFDELELLDEAGNEFSEERVMKGELTPVFFGSALANFGIRTFFDTFISYASPPKPRKTDKGLVNPDSETFTGYIFKIQANMNPAHRDRIAFLRICSGKFTRGMSVRLTRTNKTINLNQTQQFLASSRETVDEAYAGDIIGIYDPNMYQIGDTLTAGKEEIHYQELPQFPPELFRKVRVKNVMKSKQFKKGIEQLVQEGALQLFRQESNDDIILGAVGQLQFEVFEYRMKAEYNVEVEFTSLGERIPRWLSEVPKDLRLFDSRSLLAKDRFGRFVVLFENDFTYRYFKEKNKDIELIDLFEENDYKSV
ncbi:peptide chain release factor 3 [Calidifontibacillus erzurumensis]|uniref:Peptide chain release factor 3 n=1 Tax=Calidifontibacillus erzurumensis TaxID=2741433 RepID=A0A8J8KDT0_9BACI|nr:peptide chain release factor 3 [Calidifontibacillus erzurumensis]NSL53318.1 peptide chain release factor 3 [Calidifontibacillus erzurumensis]